MDNSGVLVLFMLVAGIILFYLVRKYTATDSSATTGSSSAAATSPGIPDSRKPPAKTYITIYDFKVPQNVRKCDCCDGENPFGATLCCICGYDMSI